MFIIYFLVEHLAKYLSMRLALEEEKKNESGLLILYFETLSKSLKINCLLPRL
jgi:hypothetical protein